MSKLQQNDINNLLQSLHNNNFTLNGLKNFQNTYKNVKISSIIYPKTGDSIIHVCARLGRIDFLEYIFKNWDSNVIDLKNNDDKTPLHEAAQFSQYEACEILIKHGAKVNSIKRSDWTPLMLASTKIGESAYKIVELLLKEGAITDLCNKDGWTALHLACREGDLKLVQILIKNGDCIKIKTKNGRTVLHIAALHGHYDIVVLLLKYLSPNEIDNSGNNILHEATLSNNIKIIDFLISCGVDINSVNNIGFSCLHLAASEGLINLIGYFVSKYKIDVNFKSSSGLTALHCAARNKQNKAMDILIKLGANINIKDNHGRTANDYIL